MLPLGYVGQLLVNHIQSDHKHQCRSPIHPYQDTIQPKLPILYMPHSLHSQIQKILCNLCSSYYQLLLNCPVECLPCAPDSVVSTQIFLNWSAPFLSSSVPESASQSRKYLDITRFHYTSREVQKSVVRGHKTRQTQYFITKLAQFSTLRHDRLLVPVLKFICFTY